MTAKDISLITSLLDERFKGVQTAMNAEFSIVNGRLHSYNRKLEQVVTQTTKTNGSVAAVTERVIQLEKQELIHFVNCPQTSVIAELKKEISVENDKRDEDLQEYHVVKRYPKLALSIIAGTCILLVLGTYLAYRGLADDIRREIQVELKKDTLNKLR